MSYPQEVALRCVFPGVHPIVNIIAVDGLPAPGSSDSWVKKIPAEDASAEDGRFGQSNKKKGSKEVIWLRDLLPHVIPNARIFVYNYKLDKSASKNTASAKVIAKKLIHLIHEQRRLEKEIAQRATIFISYSFGGKVVKEALFLSYREPQYRYIAMSICGFLFLGPRHQDIGLFSSNRITSHSPFVNHEHGTACTSQSQGTRAKSRDLTIIAGETGMKLLCFEDQYETESHTENSKKILVIEYTSMIEKYEIVTLPLEYSELTKFGSLYEPGFNLVTSTLKRLVEESKRFPLGKESHKDNHDNNDVLRPLNFPSTDGDGPNNSMGVDGEDENGITAVTRSQRLMHNGRKVDHRAEADTEARRGNENNGCSATGKEMLKPVSVDNSIRNGVDNRITNTTTYNTCNITNTFECDRGSKKRRKDLNQGDPDEHRLLNFHQPKKAKSRKK